MYQVFIEGIMLDIQVVEKFMALYRQRCYYRVPSSAR